MGKESREGYFLRPITRKELDALYNEARLCEESIIEGLVSRLKRRKRERESRGGIVEFLIGVGVVGSMVILLVEFLMM